MTETLSDDSIKVELVVRHGLSLFPQLSRESYFENEVIFSYKVREFIKKLEKWHFDNWDVTDDNFGKVQLFLKFIKQEAGSKLVGDLK